MDRRGLSVELLGAGDYVGVECKGLCMGMVDTESVEYTRQRVETARPLLLQVCLRLVIMWSQFGSGKRQSSQWLHRQ